MANVPPPPGKGKGKGTPPASNAAAHVVGNNTTKPEAGELVPMNFKVDSELKKDFKMFAAMHDMSMVDLLKEAFALYKEHKGS